MVPHPHSVLIACVFFPSVLILITPWTVSYWWIPYVPFSSLLPIRSFLFGEFISSFNIYPPSIPSMSFSACAAASAWHQGVRSAGWSHVLSTVFLCPPQTPQCPPLAFLLDPCCNPDLRLLGNNLPRTKQQLFLDSGNRSWQINVPSQDSRASVFQPPGSRPL